MQLSLQNFTTLVSNSAAALQGASARLVDVTVGSVLRAVLEANASIALWMQWLILQVLAMTRAATSNGPDLDSWMADFAVLRLPGSAANGNVTFSRYTPVAAALVPVGTVVRTGDGSRSFLVVGDSANPAWSGAQAGYTLAAGAASVTVPAQAQIAGTAGNVQAGSVSQMATAVPGVDGVTNAAPFAGGLDAESDDSLRARFQNYIASRSRATTTAVGYAISSVQQGLSFTVQENVDGGGNPRPGSFLVTLDDGTGSPSATLVQAVTDAVAAVRPIGTTFAVAPPQIVWANVSMAIGYDPSVARSDVVAAINNAMIAYIDKLPIGGRLAWSRLAKVAYDAHAAVTNVVNLTVNGGTGDIVPPASGVVKAGSVVVN